MYLQVHQPFSRDPDADLFHHPLHGTDNKDKQQVLQIWLIALIASILFGDQKHQAVVPAKCWFDPYNILTALCQVYFGGPRNVGPRNVGPMI